MQQCLTLSTVALYFCCPNQQGTDSQEKHLEHTSFWKKDVHLQQLICYTSSASYMEFWGTWAWLRWKFTVQFIIFSKGTKIRFYVEFDVSRPIIFYATTMKASLTRLQGRIRSDVLTYRLLFLLQYLKSLLPWNYILWCLWLLLKGSPASPCFSSLCL